MSYRKRKLTICDSKLLRLFNSFMSLTCLSEKELNESWMDLPPWEDKKSAEGKDSPSQGKDSPSQGKDSPSHLPVRSYFFLHSEMIVLLVFARLNSLLRGRKH